MNRVLRSREPWISQNYNSFIVPIVVSLVIIWLVIKFVFFWSNESLNRSWNYINIDPWKENSEIYIYMSWDSKKQITEITKMYSTDSKLEVINWEAKIILENNKSNIYLDKLWELSYKWQIWEKNIFTLINSQLWTEILSHNIQVNLRNFDVLPENNSVIAFSQNLMASNIYVLKWWATLNLIFDWKQIVWNIWVGQKLTILNSDLKNKDFKLTDKIEPIDELFKTETWFIKHNWWDYLKSLANQTNLVLSWESGSWINIIKNQKPIIFINPEDESQISWNTIDIEWKINDINITKITLNDIEISFNKETWNFIAKWFKINDAIINNIIYKIYDQNNNLLNKWVYVLYKDQKNINTSNKPTVITYPISDKDFKIISPQINPFKTTENVVKVAWQINSWVVKFIKINWFKLTKFIPYSTNWYYFANKDYGTMNDGINLYNIKYYDKNDELLFEHLFTIVKESEEIKTDSEKPISNTWNIIWNSSNNS